MFAMESPPARTPCHECPKPILWDANIEAWELFQLLAESAVRIAGMGGVAGLDLATLPVLMRIRGVPPKYYSEMWTKVSAASSVFTREMNKRMSEKT